MLFDFNQVAHEYDHYYQTEHGKQVDLIEKEAVNQYLQLINKDGNNLEIGCGTGHWTSFFTAKGFPVTAIDLSTEMLQNARKKQVKDARFLQMDAHHLEFSDASFQNVFSIATLEFVQDPDKAWSEINRVLIPGGHFLIGGLNLHSPIGKHREQDPVLRNANFFTAELLKQRLEKIGVAQIKGTLVMDDQFQIQNEKDYDQQYLLERGCFLVGLVKKFIK